MNTSQSIVNSAVFTGWVRHRRFAPKLHQFRYAMYMLAIDLDELTTLDKQCAYFRNEKFAPLSFRRSDYLGDKQQPLKAEVLNEVDHQGGDSSEITRVVMVGQVRCFGVYFSPINMFFCYRGEHADYMLAEVNSTPWGERCCYLVDLDHPHSSPKKMHVSPFMAMAMRYQWRVKPPAKRMSIHIENYASGKPVFDATLILKRTPLSNASIRSLLKTWPLMTLTIVRAIYWQALRLALKRIPFVQHPISL